MIGISNRRPTKQQQTAITRSVPAPVGGVNARDAIAEMPPTDCIIGDNWFGFPSYVAVRSGCTAWATGLPAAVESVMAYNGLTTRKMFAASNGSIYDITASGAVGAAVVTGLHNSQLNHAMFNSGSGNVLLWCNGGDTPQVYNGTTWAASTVSGSGLTPSNLITPIVFKQRVWYIENNTMNVWYSATSAYQGALTQLPLGQLFTMGGYLMAMADWTIDNVAGIDDYAAFITSEGQVAIYQGYDPSQQSTWSLVGVFKIGRPIGRRCIVKYGSDVLCITADGLVPLSKALLTDRTQLDANLTDKIVNAINADVQQYSANFGWQVIEHPIGRKLILNVPEVVDGTAHQWVMNTVTHSWWRFKNWNAQCFEKQQDTLYYGGNQTVYVADTGVADNGSPITVDCKPAFSYFELQGMLKNFMFARPIFQTTTAVQPTITLNVDYNDVIAASLPLITGSLSPWDTSPWDVSPWADGAPSTTVKNWLGIAGLGYAASGRVSMQIEGIQCQWYSTDYIFEAGGPI